MRTDLTRMPALTNAIYLSLSDLTRTMITMFHLIVTSSGGLGVIARLNQGSFNGSQS
jgi:hypothetical protein